MVSVCFRLLQIISLKISHIGAFSYWLQTGFRLVSDWHEEFQIASSDFRLLHISSDSFQTGSLRKIQTVGMKTKTISDCSLKNC